MNWYSMQSKIKNRRLFTISNLIGICSSFYLATYLVLRGGLAEAPLILVSLISLITLLFDHRESLLSGLKRNDSWFVYALILFGVWTTITVWIHNGDVSFYETPARLILGGLVAIPILKIGVDIRWIQLGAIIGTVLLSYTFLLTYSGGRFAPTINATKWGNSIAFQSILCFSLAIVSKGMLKKSIFLLFSMLGFFFVGLTGTRGAFLPLVLSLIFFGVLVGSAHKRKAIISLLVIAFLSVGVSNVPIVKDRIAATQGDMLRISQDDFKGSMGQRLTMWYAGFQEGIRNPVLGGGYDFHKTMTAFDAPTSGLASAASLISKSHSNHHSVYVDTLARTGFIGLILFLAILFLGLRNSDTRITLLCIAPFVGFAGAGLSDSVLQLGITVTYFVFSGAILKSVKFG